jgi:hypothetical protein
MIRPLLAFPLIIYVWKVIVWDKVLGWGSTDPITGMVADWMGMIITPMSAVVRPRRSRGFSNGDRFVVSSLLHKEKFMSTNDQAPQKSSLYSIPRSTMVMSLRQ